jgi:LCP family protein required for cell wall assembly
MPRDDEEPQYRVYRSRPKLFGRRAETARGDRGADGLRELRGDQPASRRSRPEPAPQYVKHGGRKGLRLPRRGRRPNVPGAGFLAGLTFGRVVKWLVLAVLGWSAVSLLLFLVSAQIQRSNTTRAARDALDPGGFTLTSANTILVLGSDARTKKTAEPGSSVGGPSRSDSILLIRAGGGKSARLSIPRDTVVDIPGHGRDKVNAAYAIGGPALTITTLKQYLGIDINHVVEVNFGNFPEFIDALGGVTVHTGCVRSDINGGRRNGGTTLRLHAGENHINGKQALALARTRKNACNPAEDDLTRARRQQKLMAAIKHRLVSPVTFLRAPWVAWAAPKAIRSDMAGPALLGLFGAVATSGDPATRVLKPSSFVTLPDGGSALEVSDAERRREVRAFLKG